MESAESDRISMRKVETRCRCTYKCEAWVIKTKSQTERLAPHNSQTEGMVLTWAGLSQASECIL